MLTATRAELETGFPFLGLLPDGLQLQNTELRGDFMEDGRSEYTLLALDTDHRSITLGYSKRHHTETS